MTAIRKKFLIAQLKGTTVGGALTTTQNIGCTGAYVGVGILDLTLDEGGADTLECHLSIVPETVLIQYGVVQTSDTVKRITFSTGANGVDVVAESAFNILVWKIPGTF